MEPVPPDLPTITRAQVARLADAAFLTDADGAITAWNTAAAELLGHPATNAVGRRCAVLLEGVKVHGAPVCTHPCLIEQRLLATQRISRTPAHPTAHPDMVARHSDGGRLNLSVVAMAVAVDGIPMLLHLLRHDAQSGHDPLTGSLSRDAFTVRVLDEQNRALRIGSSPAVALVDVDGLKAINDAHGHATGDRLLIGIADALRAGRRADLVARWGGDEFVVLLPDAAPVEGARRLRRTLRLLRHTVTVGGEPATFSAGVAQLEAQAPFTMALQMADEALYKAKRRGGACVLVARAQRSRPPGGSAS
ncbi:MAG: diguanylate cyclase [Candidatus Dormiibacterota bacterium]